MTEKPSPTGTETAAAVTHEAGGSNEAQAVHAARTLIAQYGEDAQVIAMMRVSELGFAGDMDGYAFWEMVLAAIEVLTDPATAKYDA
ncbi:hypothetical protein [Pyruvatibacter mobilis]|uniref:hypothetical protein n=1 Tax=Pyruvatibacter mobilis TaxID=1712261 RepID=UPI003D0F2550